MSEMILEKLKASETDFEKIGLPKLEKGMEELQVISKEHFEKTINANTENTLHKEWRKQVKKITKENNIDRVMNITLSLASFCLISIPPIFNFSGENAILYLLLGGMSGYWVYWLLSKNGMIEKIKSFEEYRIQELDKKYNSYFKKIILSKDEITPFYETLHNYYGEEQFSIEIKRAKKEDEEVGSYTLLKRLYDNAINHEKENAKRQRQSESGEELNAQVRLLLQK